MTPFFELIRIAIGNKESFSQSPSEKDWQEMYEESKRQAITAFLYDGILRLPEEQRPPRQILLNWTSATDYVASKNLQTSKDALIVSKKFRKVGFRNVIMKGQAIASYYPTPLHRTPGDIDVWLDADRKKIINYVRHYFPHERVQWLEICFPILQTTIVEAHTAPSLLFNPFDNRRLQNYFNKHREELFAGTYTAEVLEGKHIPTLSTRVNMVFQLTHIYRHLFQDGIGLRQLLDYYFLLQIPEAQTLIEETRNTIKSLHMTRFTSALMWVLTTTFGLQKELCIVPPDEAEGKFLLDEIMLAGNFGQYDDRLKVAQSKLANFWQITTRNWNFVSHYPREVLWNPPYRLLQFAWRLCNGYN